MSNSKKTVLGLGHYTATWIDGGPMVRLTAAGILPCSNYTAQLEKRPERIDPPMWNMVFFVEDTCEKKLAPFFVEALMVNNSGADAIIVHDALGEQEVKITTSPAVATQESDQFLVYAKLPRPDKGHHGCIVVPEDAMVTADRYRAFGPASKEDCEAFVVSSCSATSNLVLAGGEIPWPLLV